MAVTGIAEDVVTTVMAARRLRVLHIAASQRYPCWLPRLNTLAGDLLRTALTLVTVAELPGHTSLDFTLIYTGPTGEDLDTAIAPPHHRPLTTTGRPVPGRGGG